MKRFFQMPTRKQWLRFLGVLLLILIAGGLKNRIGLLFSSQSAPETIPLQSVKLLPPCPPFMAGKKESQRLQFAAIGDSGSGTKDQYQLAAVMFQQYQQEPFQFVLMLGDNIYEKGDVKTYGEARFTRPYRPLLDRGVAFYPALGNHDVFWGFMNDQLAFFKMPGRYYTFTKGDVRFWALDTNQFDTVQAKWLEQTMANSTARWRIVYGHHPLYSSGLHGSSVPLQKSLQPLLERGHADLYLAGHDHDYERFKPVHGVTYIVSGGGGAYLRKFRLSETGSIVRKSVHEFMRFQVTPQQLDFKVIDEQGHVLDAGVLSKSGEALPFCRPAAS